MKEVLALLFPPGVPAIQRWRLAMFAAVAVLIFFMLWSIGSFASTPLGDGFARASPMRAEIDHKQGELLKVISELTATVQNSIRERKRELAKSLQTQIRAQALKNCKAKTSVEREETNREIDLLQEQYAEADGGRPYDVPECGRL